MITFSDIVKTGLILWAIYEEWTKPEPPEKTTGITPEAKMVTGYLPLVYGRGLVEGTLVYADTTKKFTMTGVTVNSQQTFQAGPSAIPASSLSVVTIDPTDATKTITSSLIVPAQSALKLDTTYPTDAVSDLLYAQYTIARGDINRVVECLVDDKYISSPDLGGSARSKWDSKHSNQSALRIDIHTNGGTDAVMTANQPRRKAAAFTNIAYASCAFKLNAMNPQFTSVPKVKFLIEGRKIRTTLNPGNTAILPTRVYSNNPAWVLLDYLLDCGSLDDSLRITESMLDLNSFRETAAVCDQVIANADMKVMSARSGKFYNPTQLGNTLVAPYNAAPSVTEPLRKYECNIVLDTSKSISENVKSILLSMPEASLVWSGGKYKLLLDNPTGVTITDSDLVLSQEVLKSFPPSSSKYNYCTVTFKNESAEFVEEKVSWPPKITDSAPYRGVGPFRYSRSTRTNWGEENNGANVGPTLLNNYAVWSGESAGFTFVYKIYIPTALADDYRLRIASGDSNHRVRMVNLETSVMIVDGYASNGLYTSSVKALTAGRYSITVECTGAALFGMAGTLSQATSGAQIWNSADETYTDFIAVPSDSGKYNTLLSQDGYILSSNEISASGITDYYHAALLAKYTVEKSRDTYAISFSYIITNKLLEPGDIVTLTSKTITNSVPTRLRILQVEIDINNICKVSAVYAPVLNSDITEFLAPTVSVPVTSTVVPTPSKPVYTPYYDPKSTALGEVKWTTNDSLTVSYDLYYARYETQGVATFVLLASDIKATTYSINQIIPYISTVFAVRGYRADGTYSDLVESDLVLNLNTFNTKMITASVSKIERSEIGVLVPTTITFSTPYASATHQWTIAGVVQTDTSNSITVSTTNASMATSVKVVDATTFSIMSDSLTIPFTQLKTTSFTSTIFKRSILKPDTPTDGSFLLPVPSGWSDGIPEDNGTNLTVWMSSRLFTSDGESPQALVWKTPTELVSTSDTKLEFSVDGSTNWHPIGVPLDQYMRTTVTANGEATVSIVKIRGENGSPGAVGQGQVNGICFNRSATPLVDRPAGGTFSSPAATGWSDGVPAGTDQLYMATRIFTSDGLPPHSAVWSFPVAISKDGTSGTIRFTYSSATNAPTLPASSTQTATGWGPIPDTTTIWMSQQVNTLSATGVVLSYGTWSTPSKIKGEKGDQGLSIKGDTGDSVDIIFRRSAAAPSVVGAPANWYSNVDLVPDSTEPMWSSVGYKLLGASSFTWNTPIKIEGSSIAEITIYTRGAPSTTPSGGLYSFSSGNTLVTMPTSTGATWSYAIPAGTTPVYTSRAVVSARAGYVGNIAVTGWTTPVVSMKDGIDGSPSTVPGPSGKTAKRLYYKQLYTGYEPQTPMASTDGALPAIAYDLFWNIITWSETPYTVATGEKQWQTDAIYQPNGDYQNTVWGVPYLSLFKVGSLEAITTFTGELKSTSGTGERLTINEDRTSHEFRTYSNTNNLLFSAGDSVIGDYTVVYANPAGSAEQPVRIAYQAKIRHPSDFVNRAGVGMETMFWGHNGKPDVNGSTLIRMGETGYYLNNEFCRAFNVTYSSEAGNNAFQVSLGSHASYGTSGADTAQYAGYFASQFNMSPGSTRTSVYICDPSYALRASGNVYVTGNITATANITAYNGSDKRLKHNIVLISNPIEKLSKINGYTFTWNDDYYAKQNQDLFKRNDIGVIAQEIMEVIPEAVHEKDDGFLGVDYQKIIPLLIEAIKEQQLQIEELRNDITRLSE
jgi:hypothetical protein